MLVVFLQNSVSWTQKKMFGHSSEYLLEWFKIVPFFTSNEVLSVTKEVVFVFFFFQQDHGYS